MDTFGIHRDVETTSSGDVTTPIHDALNWRYRRFSYNASKTLLGGLIKDYKGDTWQVVTNRPNGKGRYYCCAKGEGAKALFLNTESNGMRHWHDVFVDLTTPIVITEGAGKTGALMTCGYYAIGLFGVQSFTKDGELLPDLKQIDWNGREVVIAFDEDEKQKTRITVSKATFKLVKLLEAQGAKCRIAEWHHAEGKGIDDVMVQQGWKRVEEIIGTAPETDVAKLTLYFDRWKLLRKPNVKVNAKYLPDIAFPQAGAIFLKSPKGTGKSYQLANIVKEAIDKDRRVLNITHRINLGKALCQDMGLPWIDDLTSPTNSFGLCIDSLHPESKAKINIADYAGATVVMDEIEQLYEHLLNSRTCKNKRGEILKTLRGLFQFVIMTGGRIVFADADLSDYSIRFFHELMGEVQTEIFVVHNAYSEGGYRAVVFDQPAPNHLLNEVAAAFRDTAADEDTGKPKARLYVACDAQKHGSQNGTINLEAWFGKKFPNARILRIDSNSLGDKDHPAYKCIDRINEIILAYDIVITSPSVGTGVSIGSNDRAKEPTPLFGAVIGVFNGVIAENSIRQALMRVRNLSVPRFVWVGRAIGFSGNGAVTASGLIKGLRDVADFIKAGVENLIWGSLDVKNASFDTLGIDGWARIASRRNHGLYKLEETLILGLQGEGCEVEVVTEIDEVDKDLAKFTKVERKRIRLEKQRKYCEAVANALNLSEEEYEKLKFAAKTETEQHSIVKYDLRKLYGIEPTLGLVVAHEEDRVYGKWRLRFAFQNGVEAAKKVDFKSLDYFAKNDGTLQDLRLLTAKVMILNHFEIDKLLADRDREFLATDEDVIKLAKMAYQHRDHLKNVLGMTLTDRGLDEDGKVKKPIDVLKSFFKKLGFDLESDRYREDGQLVRGYMIKEDAPELNQVFAVWQQDLDARLREFDRDVKVSEINAKKAKIEELKQNPNFVELATDWAEAFKSGVQDLVAESWLVGLSQDLLNLAMEIPSFAASVNRVRTV
ncbi:plasmid replication protein, CyRepA1 family [Leptolyngbya sp. AN03gr2]|uniref:plasmid replication protein, CyRepA1 family n=1 Tax=Leptolyngbya sp. AN03gr2 TaxID=3423364 RepID=UPI003D319681